MNKKEPKWKVDYLKTLQKILERVIFKHSMWYIIFATVHYLILTQEFNFIINSHTFYAIMAFFLIKNLFQGLTFYILHPARYQIMEGEK